MQLYMCSNVGCGSMQDAPGQCRRCGWTTRRLNEAETTAPVSTDKRLFTVWFETGVVVLAENEEQAEKLAKDGLLSHVVDADAWEPSPAVPMNCFPAGWESDSIPFGERDPEDPDRTIAQWIERGAAPEYTELRDKLTEARVKLMGDTK